MSKITETLHAIPVDELTGAVSVPVYQTSTYVQEAPGVNKGYDYGRTGNPTRRALEKIVAQLESGDSAFAFATGLAAIDSVLKLLSAGDEIVAVDDIYGGAYRLFTNVYQKMGIRIKYVDTTDVQNVANAITDRTRLVWIESPTNPTLKITDIAAVCQVVKEVSARFDHGPRKSETGDPGTPLHERDTRPLVVVDNTFASPVVQNPIELGADLVIHSATKYLGGHADLLAGIVVTATPELSAQIKYVQNASGGILAPWDCFLVIRGIETLELRVERQCENAMKVARFLAEHPDVDQVYYPGLEGHKNHDIAKSQQKGLFGGIVSFTLKQDTEEAAIAFVSSTKYFKLAESLGGVRSLCCQPAKMTHASVPRERRLASGIKDSLIRLSVGIEAADDLTADLAQAFEAVRDGVTV